MQVELAQSLEQLGNLYFELKNDVGQPFKAHQQAIELYRQVGDRLGEANVLQAYGQASGRPSAGTQLAPYITIP